MAYLTSSKIKNYGELTYNFIESLVQSIQKADIGPYTYGIAGIKNRFAPNIILSLAALFGHGRRFFLTMLF